MVNRKINHNNRSTLNGQNETFVKNGFVNDLDIRSSSTKPFCPTDNSLESIVQKHETSFSILCEVSFPLLIAGLGMAFAGLLLDHTQNTEVFIKLNEIYILVPALLGLKGNLEMTMASRMSSIANLGLLKSFNQRYEMFVSNIALTQCQSIVVGFSGALFAALMSFLNTGVINWSNTALLCVTSILTASLASLILGSIMMFVIIWSLDYKINPDNIATPIAAALGDLITLYILYNISIFLYSSTIFYRFTWLYPLLIFASLLLVPIWWRIAARNSQTKVALSEGWLPVIMAMIISSFGGCILNFAVFYYKTIALYQPLINGVGGNLVAIQASRMSTFLHRVSTKLGDLSNPKAISSSLNPLSYLFRKDIHSRTARLLLSLVIPSHLIFLFVLQMLHNQTTIDVQFLLPYLGAALLQVFLLLWFAEMIIHWMWNRGIDPDNSSIPYLTAFGDLFGTMFLLISFAVSKRFRL